MSGSVSYDRIAEQYDRTRDALAHGQRVAAQVAPYLPGGRVLEIGAGTGAVTVALRDRGVDVVGLDLSPAMLARAAERVPGRVAVADAARLPAADGSVDVVLAVHLLHLVGDRGRVAAEAARVLVPGGRFVVVSPPEPTKVTDVRAVLRDMRDALGAYRTTPAQVRQTGAAAGLMELAEDVADRPPAGLSPAEATTRIRARAWPELLDVGSERWDAVVAPALAAVGQLPDQHRRRLCPEVARAFVFAR